MVPVDDVVTALLLGRDSDDPSVRGHGETLFAALTEMLRHERGGVAVLLEFMADPETWAGELRDTVNRSGVWRSDRVQTLTHRVLAAQHFTDQNPDLSPR